MESEEQALLSHAEGEGAVGGAAVEYKKSTSSNFSELSGVSKLEAIEDELERRLRRLRKISPDDWNLPEDSQEKEVDLDEIESFLNAPQPELPEECENKEPSKLNRRKYLDYNARHVQGQSKMIEGTTNDYSEDLDLDEVEGFLNAPHPVLPEYKPKDKRKSKSNKKKPDLSIKAGHVSLESQDSSQENFDQLDLDQVEKLLNPRKNELEENACATKKEPSKREVSRNEISYCERSDDYTFHLNSISKTLEELEKLQGACGGDEQDLPTKSRPKRETTSNKTYWLDDNDNVVDEINKNLALMDLTKTTQTKVRNLTQKVNNSLGYKLIGKNSSSSDSTSPELEDSEEIVEAKTKVSRSMSTFTPKPKSLPFPAHPNSCEDLSNHIFSGAKECWAEPQKSFLDKVKPSFDFKSKPKVTFTDIQNVLPPEYTEEDLKELEECSSRMSNKVSAAPERKETPGWCKPDDNLLLTAESDQTIETLVADVKQEEKEESSYDFWHF